jgi:hypothetical protein
MQEVGPVRRTGSVDGIESAIGNLQRDGAADAALADSTGGPARRYNFPMFQVSPA